MPIQQVSIQFLLISKADKNDLFSLFNHRNAVFNEFAVTVHFK